MDELNKCKCGGQAAAGRSENRVKRRTAANKRLVEVTAKSASRRELETAQIVAAALAADVNEVRCKKCNTFVWHESLEGAINRWNKATSKLATLKDCCKMAGDRRIDYDGMVIVKCAVCGVRHAPLEPTPK